MIVPGTHEHDRETSAPTPNPVGIVLATHGCDARRSIPMPAGQGDVSIRARLRDEHLARIVAEDAELLRRLGSM